MSYSLIPKLNQLKTEVRNVLYFLAFTSFYATIVGAGG